MINPKEIVSIPDDINQGLSSAKNSTMLQVLGMPRDHVDEECRHVLNQPMKSLVFTSDVGPFRVTGLKPAVVSLKSILSKVKKEHHEVYDSLGSSGMLCVRLIRNASMLSNHCWGCAVDINIDGALDGINVGGGTHRMDGKTLAGLATIAPFFNEAGWYWGVGFSRFEDGMHFEVADQTIREWHESSKFGAAVKRRPTTPGSLALGDRGADVRRLQEVLVDHGHDLLPDGIFGALTQGAVIDFQSSNGLVPDGFVGPRTQAALGL